VTRLTALEARFTDGNVTLGVIHGAIGALSTFRDVLPEPIESPADTPPHLGGAASPEPFVALLLGVISFHDRLTHLVDRAGAVDLGATDDTDVEVADPLAGLAR
jgi:hypothetical protein